MPGSRREFLAYGSVSLLGAAAQLKAQTGTSGQLPPALPPGAPPAFNTSPAVGPEVFPATFAEAEKLVQLALSEG